MALSEHVVLYPLCFFVDRCHPARGERGVPPLLANPRAFRQATWRHLIFGEEMEHAIQQPPFAEEGVGPSGGRTKRVCCGEAP
jgi:hypothetical protein